MARVKVPKDLCVNKQKSWHHPYDETTLAAAHEEMALWPYDAIAARIAADDMRMPPLPERYEGEFHEYRQRRDEIIKARTDNIRHIFDQDNYFKANLIHNLREAQRAMVQNRGVKACTRRMLTLTTRPDVSPENRRADVVLHIRKTIVKRRIPGTFLPATVCVEALKRATHLALANDDNIFLEIAVSLKFKPDPSPDGIPRELSVSPHTQVYIKIPRNKYSHLKTQEERKSAYYDLYRQALRSYYSGKFTPFVIDRATRKPYEPEIVEGSLCDVNTHLDPYVRESFKVYFN
jgi:hypothetical protein